MVCEVLAQEETGEPETPLQGDEALDVLVHGEQGGGDHDDEEVPVHRGVETGDVLAAQGGGHVALDVRDTTIRPVVVAQRANITRRRPRARPRWSPSK